MLEEILRLQVMLDELLPHLQEVQRIIINEVAKENRKQLRIVATNPQTGSYK
jgi:hypothetical protein